jgi:adenosylmethionine-8-amino-7-oxononanoate aminotransferase
MDAFDPAERTFVSASGTMLVDARGRRLFDATSSIWTCIHGHGHPKIVEAIATQAARLDHATALGATNPVAEELARRLCELTGLARAIFASDGASAVETALKIAVQYWRNHGEPQRNRLVHLVSSYHGDTVGAMSVSDIEVFRRAFGALTFETLSYEAYEQHPDRDDIAAVIVEPRVQAAAGMRIVGDATYAALRGPRRPLLIVDEIATGFGRTGTMFAYESLDLRPDLICVGKGITGGTLALSATIASQAVYDAFLGGTRAQPRHLFHGHSYASNPIACAAGLASLDLFASEGTLEHASHLAARLSELLRELGRDARVRETRQAGLMCGVELETAALPPADERTTPAWRLAHAMYERGHFTRPIGDTIQLVPPLSSSANELEAFIAELSKALACTS